MTARPVVTATPPNHKRAAVMLLTDRQPQTARPRPQQTPAHQDAPDMIREFLVGSVAPRSSARPAVASVQAG